MPTLYGYSGLSRAGDLGIQDLLYFFESGSDIAALLAKGSAPVLWEWGGVAHRF